MRAIHSETGVLLSWLLLLQRQHLAQTSNKPRAQSHSCSSLLSGNQPPYVRTRCYFVLRHF